MVISWSSKSFSSFGTKIVSPLELKTQLIYGKIIDLPFFSTFEQDCSWLQSLIYLFYRAFLMKEPKIPRIFIYIHT